jgi:molybdate transport repressor ModE-like protein
MNVELRLGGLIKVNGHDIPVGQTLAILEAVARERSVSGAAKRLRVSYRSAWDRVSMLAEAFGQPLIEMTKGHGSVLTPLGEEVRQALEAPFRGLQNRLATEQQRLHARLAGALDMGPAPLRLAASHDPLVIETLRGRSDVDIKIMGSQQAVERLLEGSADAAGCHFGPGKIGELNIPPRLRSRDYVLRPAFTREQGLIVAPGNPLALTSIPDLVRTQARFVNRQKGSGTRGWFDRLLAGHNIDPAKIAGYEVEEFTHQAVGALIKAGLADAGLGVRAVAEALGLGFVTLGRETYFLATSADLGSHTVDEIHQALTIGADEAKGYYPVRRGDRNLASRSAKRHAERRTA